MVKKTDGGGASRRRKLGQGVMLSAAIATLAASVGVDPVQAQPVQEKMKSMKAEQLRKGTSAVQTKITKERLRRDRRQIKVDAIQNKSDAIQNKSDAMQTKITTPKR